MERLLAVIEPRACAFEPIDSDHIHMHFQGKQSKNRKHRQQYRYVVYRYIEQGIFFQEY